MLGVGGVGVVFQRGSESLMAHQGKRRRADWWWQCLALGRQGGYKQEVANLIWLALVLLGISVPSPQGMLGDDGSFLVASQSHS